VGQREGEKRGTINRGIMEGEGSMHTKGNYFAAWMPIILYIRF